MRPNNSDSSDGSDRSDKSDAPDSQHRLIPRHGGYRKLRSFQAAQIVYDATVVFCRRFVDKHSRTNDHETASLVDVRKLGRPAR
jgi:hypothetical protein